MKPYEKQADGIRYLSAENARFHPSEGGLLALTLSEDGREHTYERVAVFRSFPLTNPDAYLSVREPTGAKTEIGMIRTLSELDERSEELVRAELATRYFVPTVTAIHSLHRRGALYFDLETDLGRRTVMLRDDMSGIRVLDGGRVFMTDMEGNNYEIPDPRALDKASYRRIEIYL